MLSTRSRAEIPLALSRAGPMFRGRIAALRHGTDGLGGARAGEVVDFDQVAEPLFVRRRCRAIGLTRWEWVARRCRWPIFSEAGECRRSGGRGRRWSAISAGIVWVAGHRIAERVKATEQTVHRADVEFQFGRERLRDRVMRGIGSRRDFDGNSRDQQCTVNEVMGSEKVS